MNMLMHLRWKQIHRLISVAELFASYPQPASVGEKDIAILWDAAARHVQSLPVSPEPLTFMERQILRTVAPL